MKVITETNYTVIIDPDKPSLSVDVPFKPLSEEDIFLNGEVLTYLVEDIYADEYEWPEGVVFKERRITSEDLDTYKDHFIFIVGKYEHGLVLQYSVHSESDSRDPWDYGVAGFVAIPSDFTDPKSAAKRILEEYTNWCNGETYFIVSVPIDNPDNFETVGGFIGYDYAREAAKNGDY